MATQPGVSLAVYVNPKSLARINKRLDKFQGAPLAKRVDKALGGGARLYADALKRNSPNATGGLSRSVTVTRPRKRQGEIAVYGVYPKKRVPFKGRTALLAALLVHGTSRGVESDPFPRDTFQSMEPTITSFVSEQVRRLE